MEGILRFLPPNLHRPLLSAWGRYGTQVEEIRLRSGKPLHLVLSAGDGFLTAGGRLTSDPTVQPVLTGSDLTYTFQCLAQGSVYAWEDELRGGFMTIPGGHRVGIAGRAVTTGGRIQTVRAITGLSIRLARAVFGVAAALVPHLVAADRGLISTIVISPPRAGKTTVLRDLIRLVSAGHGGFSAMRVAVIDERSEIAGAGGPDAGLDLGPRTDVLDSCPKGAGMMMALRALSPQVLAVDEIGGPEDAAAVGDALQSGVAVLATAHARDLSAAAQRPALRDLLAAQAFSRAIILSRSRGPATVEQVWELPGRRSRLAAPLVLARSEGPMLILHDLPKASTLGAAGRGGGVG